VHVVPGYRRELDVPAKQYLSELDVIKDFCFLPYWRRAWIVQEYYLAKRKEIWYGWLPMTCNQLEHMVDFWNLKVNRDWISTPARSLLTTKLQVGLVGHESSTDSHRTFLYLFDLFRQLKCADDRDRLYALLPLLSSEERAEIGIIPDYSITTSDIFKRIASRFLRVRDLKHNDWPWEPILGLRRILRPDLQDKTVQLVILSLRGWTARYAVDPCICKHACLRGYVRYPKIDARGCSYCHRIPVLSFASLDPSKLDHFRQTEFSSRDWKVWTKALLASDEDLDRELGTKVRNDRYFKNWDWNIISE
jgi:hypothetical protein